VISFSKQKNSKPHKGIKERKEEEKKKEKEKRKSTTHTHTHTLKKERENERRELVGRNAVWTVTYI